MATLAWISPQSLTGQTSNPTMSVSLVQNHDDDDLYIIGAVCLSVCQQKSLFLYSKDLGVSHVYRHFLY